MKLDFVFVVFRTQVGAKGLLGCKGSGGLEDPEPQSTAKLYTILIDPEPENTTKPQN